MKRYSYNEVKEYTESFEYRLLSTEYLGNREKLSMVCPKGHVYNASFGSFKSGKRCAECNGTKRLTYDKVLRYIESFGYSLLSEKYLNNRTKMLIRCDAGHDFEMCYHDFQGGHRCPVCTNNKKLTIEHVRDFVKKEGYELLSEEYINNSSKLIMKCQKGHIFEMSFASFQQGRRCPVCRLSKGETKIIKLLEESNVIYIHQHRIPDCKDKATLPFDFYLPCQNLAIEYDGIQHFEAREAFGGEKEFEDRKRKDAIKTNYCKDNGINLIRIPYWDFNNIEEILSNQLNLYIG